MVTECVRSESIPPSRNYDSKVDRREIRSGHHAFLMVDIVREENGWRHAGCEHHVSASHLGGCVTSCDPRHQVHRSQSPQQQAATGVKKNKHVFNVRFRTLK